MSNAVRIMSVSLALAGFAAPSFAELHKCTTKEGKVVYTEFECEKDATKAGVVIRDSAGVDGTKAAPGKSSPAAGAPKSAPPGTPPSGAAPKKDPITEAMERNRAKAEQDKQGAK